MNATKSKDWTRTCTIAGYAKYLREQSGALCVVVLRVQDGVLSADPSLKPEDCDMLVCDRIAGLVADLRKSREEKRPAARVELGENRE